MRFEDGAHTAAGDTETRHSLPVEVERGEERVLILNGHNVEPARALGWEFLPAACGRKGVATYNRLFVISNGDDQPGPVAELELGIGLSAAKEAYEQEHPETRRAACGGGRKGKGTRCKTGLSGSDTPVPRFTLQAAEALEVGETRIEELIRLANELKGDARKRFASGEITRSEALRQLPAARKRGALRGKRSLASAIFSLERALERASDVSAKDRERLEGLVVMIREILDGPAEGLPVLTEDGAVRLPVSNERR